MHLKQSSQAHLINKDSSNFNSTPESSESQSLDGHDSITKRAIQGVIEIQSEDDSSRDTLKPSKLANYSSSLVIPNNHLKLTKLKREIYKQKSSCEELTEKNKKKMKHKKELEDEVERLKRQIDDLMNSKETYVTESDHNFVENKYVKATSTRHDWSKIKMNEYLDDEDKMEMMDEVLRNTISSGVETDYWKKVSERNRFTAAGHARLHRLDGFEDQVTAKKNNVFEIGSESKNMISKGFSTQQDFFGPTRPLPSNINGPKHASESISDNL
jgi:flagellar biosynthesis GTPase FlhF